jgi:hypothetical protein
MITTKGDKQDQEEGDRIKKVISPKKDKLHKEKDELF